ncbi:hypothetical protein G6F65_018478 [Rhizopus arrhizus]|nr:hypothetical protein G6F65_018478 [Rhizopus arrhizus]
MRTMNSAQNPVAGVTDASIPAPAAAQAATPAASDPSTAFKVLGAISVAHLMNDMIQSILLAIYPMLKESFTGCIAAATVHWLLHRPPSEAVFLAGGHGLHAGGLAAAVGGAVVRLAVGGGRAGGSGVLGVSSGIVAGGAHGLGRPPRSGTVALPGGWQRGLGAGAAAGGALHHSARAGQRGVVFAGGVVRHRRADGDRTLVQRQPRTAQAACAARRGGQRAVAQPGAGCLDAISPST